MKFCEICWGTKRRRRDVRGQDLQAFLLYWAHHQIRGNKSDDGERLRREMSGLRLRIRSNRLLFMPENRVERMYGQIERDSLFMLCFAILIRSSTVRTRIVRQCCWGIPMKISSIRNVRNVEGCSVLSAAFPGTLDCNAINFKN